MSKLDYCQFHKVNEIPSCNFRNAICEVSFMISMSEHRHHIALLHVRPVQSLVRVSVRYMITASYFPTILREIFFYFLFTYLGTIAFPNWYYLLFKGLSLLKKQTRIKWQSFSLDVRWYILTMNKKALTLVYSAEPAHIVLKFMAAILPYASAHTNLRVLFPQYAHV